MAFLISEIFFFIPERNEHVTGGALEGSVVLNVVFNLSVVYHCVVVRN